MKALLLISFSEDRSANASENANTLLYRRPQTPINDHRSDFGFKQPYPSC
jgi:hypothetical protein